MLERPCNILSQKYTYLNNHCVETFTRSLSGLSPLCLIFNPRKMIITLKREYCHGIDLMMSISNCTKCIDDAKCGKSFEILFKTKLISR